MSRGNGARLFAATMAAMLMMAGARADKPPPAELCDAYSGLPDGDGPHAGMVWITGGSFNMGDDDERPEERAAHEVTVAGFWIDRHEVTNAQFARFVAATGYVTIAERGLDPTDHPGVPPELLAPGAVVFTPPDGLLNLVDISQWWRYVPGADWRHPQGPGSSIEARDNHPVVNIAYEDALARAARCRARRSGSSPRAAGWKARPTAGATRITIRSRAGEPTAGRGSFR
jgi:formylglycine-generating enzyme